MPSPTLPVPGRTAPARGRPRQLDDPRWLRENYLKFGERALSQQLGCARGTVRAALTRHGIPPAAAGPRRGVTAGRRASDLDVTEPIRLIAEYFAEDTAAATNATIRTRLVDLHHAHGNRADRIHALIELGSAIALNLEHELTLRRTTR